MTAADWVVFAILLAAVAWIGRLGALWVVDRASDLGLVAGVTERSSHLRPTPTGGGVGFVVAGLCASPLLLSAGHGVGFAVVATVAGLVLAIVGYLDDRSDLSARVRLAVHLAVVAALIASLWPLRPAVEWLGAWPLAALLALAGVWWINLFNFMDGIDGIAGQEGAFLFVAGVVLAGVGGAPVGDAASLWALSAAVATLGFLSVNWPPAKAFMGDVGSTWLAFATFAFALSTVEAGWIGHAAWAILTAGFVADATVTLLTRMATGQSWTQAHRSHLYQRLSRRLGGHRPATLTWLAVNMLWLAPLAALSEAAPDLAWPLAATAYAPLVAAAVLLGAGRPEAAASTQTGAADG